MSSSTSTLAYDIIARDRASGAFSKIGRALGGLGVAFSAAGLVRFAADAVNVEAVFSQTMASLQVNSGVSEKALGRLSEMAVKFGQDTVFSANEAAQAMLELSKGGMTAAQIKGGALESTLDLAATEGIALDASAKILSTTLKQFGLTAADSGKAVDLLAAGAVSSTASVEDMAAGLKYVGSTAKSMNYPLNDVVTALAALNNAGLDSTTAGTSLNRMMLGLTLGTTKAADAAGDLGLKFTDAKGDMLPMEDVIKRLDQAFGDMSTSQRNNDLKKIFGVEGMRAANILLDQGAKGWENLGKKVDKTGVAAKMADARMSGTKGSLERLSGAAETAQLKLGKALAPAVQTVSDALADNLGPAMDGAIDLGGDLVDAVEPLVGILKTVGGVALDAGGMLMDLPAPVKSIAIQAGIAAAVLPKLTGAVGSATSAMKNGYTYARVYGLELADVNTRSGALSSGFSKMAGAAKAAAGVGGMLMLVDSMNQTDRAAGTMEGALGGAMTGFAVGGPWGAGIGAAAGALFSFVSATKRAGDAANDAKPDFEGLASSLDQVTGATTRATRAQIYDDLQRSGALETLNAYGVSSRTAVDAILGHGNALHQVQAVQHRATAEYEANTTAIKANEDEIKGLISSGESATDAGQARVLALQSENAELGTRNKAISKGTDIIDAEIKGLRESQKAVKEKAAAVESLRKLYKSMPKDVVTDMKQHGVPETMADVKGLIRQYDLTPPQVQTLLKQIGVDKSIGEIKRLLAVQAQFKDKTVTYTVQYRGLGGPGGVGSTRGRGDDFTGGSDPAGGAAPPKRKTGGASGRYSTERGRSGKTVTVQDGAEIRVVGIDPGAKAYFFTGGSSRY